MILVTVGTHNQGFERLIFEADRLAGEGLLKEKILMQIGSSTYLPKNAKWFRYAAYDRMVELNKEARLVVTHGGAGSIITALSSGKPTIVVPRLKKFKEAVNDHQLDLVKKLERKGRIVAVYDIKKLKNTMQDTILKGLKTGETRRLKKKNRICEEINAYIEKVGWR